MSEKKHDTALREQAIEIDTTAAVQQLDNVSENFTKIVLPTRIQGKVKHNVVLLWANIMFYLF